MRTLPWLIAGLVAMAAAQAQAFGFLFMNVSESPGDSRDCALASDGDWTVVAWCENGHEIWTRCLSEEERRPPVYHGEGIEPTICWDARGDRRFVLAWADETSIHWRIAEQEVWSPVETIVLYDVEAARRPCLTGPSFGPEGFSGFYLTWETAGEAIWFTQDLGYGWGEPELICGVAPWDEARPQAVPIAAGGGFTPRAYVMRSWDGRIEYYERSEGAWFGPGDVGGDLPLGADYDVTVGTGNDQHLLSLLSPPACPCNAIYYLEEIGGGIWQDPVSLTVDGYPYDWPQHPQIAYAPDRDVLYAFWYEEYRDHDLHVVGEGSYLFAKRPSEPDWGDCTEDLHGEIGIDCALCPKPEIVVDRQGLEHAVDIAYAKDMGGAHDVWLGLSSLWTSAPAPVAAARLDVHPNPCNPTATVRYSLPEAGRARLTVHDVRGRRLAVLADGDQAAGEHALQWAGRDGSGRPLASGLYLLRFSHSSGVEASRVVLIQ